MASDTWAGGCPGCGGDPHTGGFFHSEYCPNNPNRIHPLPSFDPLPPFPATVVGTITFAPTPTVPTFPDYGWVCPKCGAVYAPFMPYCDNCRGQDKFTTITTGSTEEKEDDE
jgi:hypothetical protein